MNTALKIIESPEQKAVALFDLSEQVFREVETYQSKEITDTESEKEVRRCRASVRDIRYKIQSRHKELNADLNQQKKNYKEMAESLIGRLLPTEQNLDAKIKAVEAVAEAAKAEKMAAEKARTDTILAEITRMENITATAQEYGLPSPRVQELLSDLEQFQVDEKFFQEFTENTISLKEKSLEIVKSCLDRTLKFEADQKILAEQEAAQKAEAERLAKIAAEQERAMKEAEAEKARAAAAAQAKREAEAAKIAADRKAIEDEKAAIQAERDRMAVEAEKVKFAERVRWCESVGAEWYVADWNEARSINMEIDNQHLIEKLKAHAEAIEINNQIDLGQAMADDLEARRLEALKPDREKLLDLVKTIEAIKMPECKSKEGQSAVRWVQNTLAALAGDLDDAVRSW